MSDVTDWLEANADELEHIGCKSGLDARLVRLVAVLALAGLEDEQIREQLFNLEVRPHRTTASLGVVKVALEQVRRLAALPAPA